MCKSDRILFEKLCGEFEDNIKHSKIYISPEVIHELRHYARDYSVNVFSNEPYSDESIGNQGIRSNALVEINLHGNVDLLLRDAIISEQLGKYLFDNYDEPDESISHLFDALFLLGLWLGAKIKNRYEVEAS